MFEGFKQEFSASLPVRPVDPDDKLPKELILSTREPIDLAPLIEKSGEAVDPPTTKRDEKLKQAPEAVLSVIPVGELEAFLDDEIFMLDFKDRLKSIVRRVSAELAVVDTDLRFHELISLFKIAPTAISACSMRYPKSEEQWEDWQQVIVKRYQIKDKDIANPPPRKYEDKKPDEGKQDADAKKSKQSRSKKQSKAGSRPGGASKASKSKPLSRQPAEEADDGAEEQPGGEEQGGEEQPGEEEGF